MTDSITLRGFVATEVRTTTADSGLAIAGFRMCTTERRIDRETGLWVDGHTNWYSVSMFRQLATNAGVSVHKGDRVIVTGRLRVRQWATDGGRSGTSVDIDADAVGHDLMWGTANFRRNISDKSSQRSTGEDSHDLPGDVDPVTGEILGSGEAEGFQPAETMDAGIGMDFGSAEAHTGEPERASAAY
ncbi:MULTISPECIES: single-stranded DNA-binding protein [Arthrobacter]|uniref:single-stranded DNA-binding protein n=1 Tax=Arthrobacter TaxID=1663 RepID=UPI001D13AA80|nr:MULTISPECIES: single-stranded DNA-binding protein [Arthrobacter]MCC3282558.1 single-stranded DNA-binding protein [Arthrobacter caoxuetaonis]MCC9193762.1 single-stranded DNA-binding protein [Arthrobacter sp. zg-Y916]